MWKCKHCANKFDFSLTSEKANHSRWCTKNPNRQETIKKFSTMNDNRFGVKKEFTVSCASCNVEFIVIERDKTFPLKEKYFCSRSCSNSIGGITKAKKYDHQGHYRVIAFKLHGKACILCQFDKVVEVHHIDENRKNNAKENLVPLCPNHHVMIHRSKFRAEIVDSIRKKLGGEM